MIVLTDIHGHFLTMMALLDKIPQKEKDKGVVIAGDMIDRGPRSRQVIQWCINNKISCVMGNHERMLLDWMFNNDDLWLANGGYQAILSYRDPDPDTGVPNDGLLSAHANWIRNLPIFLEFKDIKNDFGHLLVTHASASKVWKWSDEKRKQHNSQFNECLLWNRPRTINAIPGVFNVFGHTPCKNGPIIKNCYANIDTGCYLGKLTHGKPTALQSLEYGKLTALQFPEMIIYEQESID